MCKCESIEAFWIRNWIGSGSEDPLSLSLDLDLEFNVMRKWIASMPQIQKYGSHTRYGIDINCQIHVIIIFLNLI